MSTPNPTPKTYHFISGLPRSGSTLLCNILMQNPRCYASATSGLVDLMVPVRNGWDQVAALRAMPAEESERRRRDVLAAMLAGFYRHADRPIIFDKSRAWPRYIEMLEAVLGRPPKIIATVRDVRDVLASLEKLHRHTSRLSVTQQEIAAPAEFTTIEGRCRYWVRGDQVLGSSYQTLADALNRGHREAILFVKYEELTAAPEATLNRIYDFIGEAPFDHDFEHVEQVITEDDRVHGFTDLHTIRPRVEPQPPQWPEVLGDIAQQYKGQEFW